MSTQCLGRLAGMPSSWRRTAIWLTIVLCLVPLSAAWFIGAWFASGLLVGATLAAVSGHMVVWGTSANDLGLGVLFFIPAVGAGLGVAALWSTVLPRALGRRPAVSLRCWQLLGLRLGSLVAVVFFGLFIVNGALLQYSGLMWLLLLAWSLITARCVTGEANQWLLNPWQAR